MSTQDIDLYREFVSKLQNEELKLDALTGIKNLFEFKPAIECKNIIRNVGLSKILHCLEGDNIVHFNLAHDVLTVCFKKFEPGNLIKMYTSHIMYLLRHPMSSARNLAVYEVNRATDTDSNLLPISEYIDVFVAVAQLVADEDVSVANMAIKITSNLPDEAYPKVLEEMKITLELNCSSRCNAFEVIVNISCKSPDLLNLSADMDYLNELIKDIQSNDILYQANILELMSKLAVTIHGLNYLIKHDALKKIAELATEAPNNSLARIIMPGYMKFFGNVAHHHPRMIFEKYPILVDTLFDSLESRDVSILPVTLDTLGYIGTTVEGKLCLAALGSRYTQALINIGLLLKNSQVEIKIRVLNCYACLIGVDKDTNAPKCGQINQRVTLMTREWFRFFSENPLSMEMLFDYCKNPFPDIRLEALTLLDAVCQHQWGEELVANTAGLIEYLLDRTLYHTKECKEVKYDVLKRISNSSAFDANIIERLQTYVKQGPHYSETPFEVAMDGDD